MYIILRTICITLVCLPLGKSSLHVKLSTPLPQRQGGKHSKCMIQINKCCGRIFFFFLFLSVQLLSVMRDHSVFSSPPQRPMTSDFEGLIYQILSITSFSYLNSSERASISLSMLSAKQGNYWYHFYNVLGMTRSLTGDWTRDLPHSKPALYR